MHPVIKSLRTAMQCLVLESSFANRVAINPGRFGQTLSFLPLFFLPFLSLLILSQTDSKSCLFPLGGCGNEPSYNVAISLLKQPNHSGTESV